MNACGFPSRTVTSLPVCYVPKGRFAHSICSTSAMSVFSAKIFSLWHYTTADYEPEARDIMVGNLSRSVSRRLIRFYGSDATRLTVVSGCNEIDIKYKEKNKFVAFRSDKGHSNLKIKCTLMWYFVQARLPLPEHVPAGRKENIYVILDKTRNMQLKAEFFDDRGAWGNSINAMPKTYYVADEAGAWRRISMKMANIATKETLDETCTSTASCSCRLQLTTSLFWDITTAT